MSLQYLHSKRSSYKTTDIGLRHKFMVRIQTCAWSMCVETNAAYFCTPEYLVYGVK